MTPLISFLFVARVLGKNEFGAFGAVYNMASMLGVAGSFGVGVAATVLLAKSCRSDKEIAGRIYTLTSILAYILAAIAVLLGALVAPYAAREWFGGGVSVTALQIAALLLACNVINSFQLAALSGFEAFRETARASIWAGVLSILLMPAALLGLNWAIGSLVAGGVVNCLVTGLILRQVANRHKIIFRVGNFGGIHGKILQLALPAGLANLLYAPVLWYCTVLLVQRPDGLAEMAEFTAANQWKSVAMIIPAVLGQAALPILSRGLVEDGIASVRSAVKEMITKLFYFGLPCLLLLSIFSGTIMQAYGPEFGAGWFCFIVLQIVAFLQTLQSPIVKLLECSGGMWILTILNLVHGLVMFATAYFLIDLLGAAGLGLSLLAAISLNGYLLGVFLRRINRCGGAFI